jgi:hypothetical protein
MSFAITREWRRRLLGPRLVREDVYIQGLESDEVQMIREELQKGLTPNGFEVVEDTLNPSVRTDRIAEPFAGGVSDG